MRDTAFLPVTVADLRLIDQGISDKLMPVQIFLMHIDTGYLTIIVGRVVVDAFVGVAAAGIYGYFKTVGCAATTFLLRNGTQNVEELADCAIAVITNGIQLCESSPYKS